MITLSQQHGDLLSADASPSLWTPYAQTAEHHHAVLLISSLCVLHGRLIFGIDTTVQLRAFELTWKSGLSIFDIPKAKNEKQYLKVWK